MEVGAAMVVSAVGSTVDSGVIVGVIFVANVGTNLIDPKFFIGTNFIVGAAVGINCRFLIGKNFGVGVAVGSFIGMKVIA